MRNFVIRLGRQHWPTILDIHLLMLDLPMRLLGADFPDVDQNVYKELLVF